MSQATVSLPSPKAVPTLFGVHDEHLKRVRVALGVEIVLRNGQLHITGGDPQVAQAVQVFEHLREISEHTSVLRPEQVQGLLDEVLTGQLPAAETMELVHGSRNLRARTEGQTRYVQAVRTHDMTLCVGPAGSGKTFIAVAMAVNALREKSVRKIVLVRPAVEAGEKLGFLPGDIQAKVNPYQRPLLDALHEMMQYEQIHRYLDNDVIEIIPLAYMRGRTLNDSFIILDEGQNTTVPQMKMFLTRMGMRSKIVVTGDITQIDLPPHTRSGLKDAVRRLHAIDGVAIVQLSQQDIVRHRLVQEIVQAYEATEEAEQPLANLRTSAGIPPEKQQTKEP